MKQQVNWWKKKSIRIAIVLFVLICSSCQSMNKLETYNIDLTENIENYAEIFEEYNVDAKIVMYEDTEHLQLTFSDGFSALYKYGLNSVQKDLQREEEGYVRSAELHIRINDETADVFISIGDDRNGVTGGTTGGEFILPDFSEMLPGRGFRNDDVSTLRSIESWISTQEMAELYKEAKEMEQRMLEYNGSDEAM